MLEHKSVKTINAPIDYCLRCVSNPEEFFKHSKYTYTVKKIGEDLYEVVFRWVKWGIERFYKVRIRVKRTGDRVSFKSTRDSPYHFTLEFTFKSLPGESTEITVYSSMKAGLMADLLGRRDYREFIEELVEKGILGVARKMASTLEAPASGVDARCTSCLIYDQNRRYCYALRTGVEDPGKPPCGGKYFLSRQLILGVEE